MERGESAYRYCMIEITYCMAEPEQNRIRRPQIREYCPKQEYDGQQIQFHYLLLPWWSLSEPVKRREKSREETLLRKLKPLLSADAWMETKLAERLSWRQPAASAALILCRLQAYKNRQAVILIEAKEASSEDREIYAELLEKLYGELNYLTVIGDCGREYEELAEQIYTDSGLVLCCMEEMAQGYHYGREPLVLNFGERKRASPAHLPKGSACVHISAEMPKFLDTIAKNGYTNLVIGDTRKMEVHRDGRKEKYINIRRS